MSDSASQNQPLESSSVTASSVTASAGDPLVPEKHAAAEGSSTGSLFPPAELASDDQLTVISSIPPYASTASEGAPRDPAELIVGERIGHFDLLEYVAGGGMGRVFRALDTRLARTVALKILLPNQATDAETIQRFKNEAQSAARLDHDNIARVYYVGEDRGLHYIAFEFIEGINIRDLVQQHGPLPLTDTVSYVLQVASALAHAAERDVVHRDIKPSNILITPQGRAKLVDMGLARLQKFDHVADDLTASGVTLGTFDYISPEQARDPRAADVRSDIYSLGCTFYFMLAGHPPFPGGTVLQKLLQHQSEEPAELRQLRPDLPDPLAAVIRKMLVKDPRRRYAHPAELVEDLLPVAEELGVPGTGLEIELQARGRRQAPLWARHLPWLLPAAALLVVVFLLNQFWSASARRNQPHLPPLLSEMGNEADAAPRADRETHPDTQLPPPRDPDGQPNDKPPAASPPEAPPNTTGIPPGETPSSGSGDPAGHLATGNETKPPGEPTDVSAGAIGPGTGRRDDTHGPGSTELGIPPTGDGISLAAAGGAGLTAAGENTPEGETLTLAGRDSTSPPAPDTPAVSDGPRCLIVAPGSEAPGTFPSLLAARGEAESGDVIELHFDGPQAESPVRMTDLDLTIRAGAGFRPVVAFRPDPQSAVDDRSVLTVIGGQLTLSGVALELDLSGEVITDHWSIIEVQRARAVRLEKCSLTISNTSAQSTALHPGASFIRIRSATDTADGASLPEETDAEGNTGPSSVEIQLTDCIARGEAAFVHIDSGQPVQLAWENGLVVVTEPFALIESAATAVGPDDRLQIDLRHVTAVFRGGLYRASSAAVSLHPPLPVHVTCSGSIVMGTAEVPLVEQAGSGSVADLQSRFTWKGDHNFFEGFTTLWKIAGTDDMVSFDATAWIGAWPAEEEAGPVFGGVLWQELPPAGSPVCTHGPAGYTLSPVADNPALAAARYGRDVGMQANLLPIPPQPKSPLVPSAND